MSVRDGLFSSESVSEGHPDKLADRISDAVLDEFLRPEPGARVASLPVNLPLFAAAASAGWKPCLGGAVLPLTNLDDGFRAASSEDRRATSDPQLTQRSQNSMPPSCPSMCRFMNVNGKLTRCIGSVAPKVLSLSATWTAALVCTLSLASAERVM